jgi:DNA-binding transcriptional MerR regulator
MVFVLIPNHVTFSSELEIKRFFRGMSMSTSKGLLTIGDVARRTGLAVSAIRYYDDEGLVSARRTPGGKRMFIRSDIRRLSFILIAQKMGFSLEEIRTQLKQLPLERTPTKRDWEKISRGFRTHLDASASPCSSGSGTGSTAASAAAACRLRPASSTIPMTVQPGPAPDPAWWCKNR